MDFMAFGKHKGRLISDIPTDYLEWGSKALKGGIQRQFVTELGRRTGKPEPPRVQQSTSCGSWDCSRLFDPNSDWPEAQPWDGSSPPWEDQIGSDEMSAEFRAMFS